MYTTPHSPTRQLLLPQRLQRRLLNQHNAPLTGTSTTPTHPQPTQRHVNLHLSTTTHQLPQLRPGTGTTTTQDQDRFRADQRSSSDVPSAEGQQTLPYSAQAHPPSHPFHSTLVPFPSTFQLMCTTFHVCIFSFDSRFHCSSPPFQSLRSTLLRRANSAATSCGSRFRAGPRPSWRFPVTARQHEPWASTTTRSFLLSTSFHHSPLRTGVA